MAGLSAPKIEGKFSLRASTTGDHFSAKLFSMNGYFADAILGQHISLRRKFSALDYSTIS